MTTERDWGHRVPGDATRRINTVIVTIGQNERVRSNYFSIFRKRSPSYSTLRILVLRTKERRLQWEVVEKEERKSCQGRHIYGAPGPRS